MVKGTYPPRPSRGEGVGGEGVEDPPWPSQRDGEEKEGVGIGLEEIIDMEEIKC